MNSSEQSLAEFVLELSRSVTVQQSVDEIVGFATETLNTPHAGIILIRSGGKRFKTFSPTTPAVAEADSWQEKLREGPCIDAAVESRTIRSNDLSAGTRWPLWGPKAVSLGFHSILFVELHAGEGRIGALNLYGDKTREFTEDEAHTAQLFAHHAAAGLNAARNFETLSRAVVSRSVIGQAQGLLMERFSIDAKRAFSILARYSQDSNVSVVHVAEERDCMHGQVTLNLARRRTITSSPSRTKEALDSGAIHASKTYSEPCPRDQRTSPGTSGDSLLCVTRRLPGSAPANYLGLMMRPVSTSADPSVRRPSGFNKFRDTEHDRK